MRCSFALAGAKMLGGGEDNVTSVPWGDVPGPAMSAKRNGPEASSPVRVSPFAVFAVIDEIYYIILHCRAEHMTQDTFNQQVLKFWSLAVARANRPSLYTQQPTI